MEKGSPMSHMRKTPMSKSSILKSPMPKSPMPKSPMPKSPIPKSPVAYEKYKSRCIYGLISFFHFRHRYSKKLISDADRRSLNGDALGDRYIENRLDLHSDKNSHDVLDKKPMRIQKIGEGDMSIEPQTKKKTMTAKVENVQSDSQLLDDLSKNPRKAMKPSRRSRRLYGCYDVSTVENSKPAHQNLADSERCSKSIDSEVSAEAHLQSKNESICNCKSTNCVQHEQIYEINLQVSMNESAEAFINQKLIDGKHFSGDGTSNQSKHFLDALEILNSNKDLFIKLLQDPNSLLVKHIEDLRDSKAKEQQNKSFTEDELSENQETDTKECNLSKETGGFQPLEKIVVFKPRPESLQTCEGYGISHDTPRIHYDLRNVQQSVRPAFFAKQMKRKLMHALGLVRKDQQLISTDGPVHQKYIHDFEGFGQCVNGTFIDSIERNSPEKSSSDFGGISRSSTDVKRKHQIDKVNEFDPVVRDEAASNSEIGHENLHLSTIMHPKRNKHDEHVEPRVSISELKIGNANFLMKQRIKTWDGVSSVPEFDLLPTVSSRRSREHGFVSSRFSPYGDHQMASENNWRNTEEKENTCSSLLKQNIEDLQPQLYEKRPNMSHKLFPDKQVHKRIVSLNNDLNHIETTFRDSEEIIPRKVPCKIDCSYNNDDSPSTETEEASEKRGSLDLSREDSPVENQTSTHSVDDNLTSPLKSQIFGEFDTIKDKEEQPSPVSVLDQFFTEEINTPVNTERQPALGSTRLLQVGIEEGCLADDQFPSDLKMSSCTSMEEHGSMSEYISRVLQSCHFSWDELASKCHFSGQLVDRSLFDNRNLQPNHICDEHRLVLDCVNEVLADVNRWYLRCSPWLSFTKPRIPPDMIAGSVADEVMKYVDWNLLLAAPSQTLEQLLVKDLTKSRTWMDIRTDAEDAVNEMVDSILEELIIEICS